MMSLVVAGGCGRSSARSAEPLDPFGATSIGALPVAALAGGSALLLPVGVVVLGDSAASDSTLVSQEYAIAEMAGRVLDSVLKRDARSVRWVGLAEQREALRMAPALGIEPDRLETAPLLGPKVESLADPLWSQLRTLMAMTGARVAVAPAGAKLDRRAQTFTASYVLVLVDARTGRVQWRGRADGPPAASPGAALRGAAAAAVPPVFVR
jgi:hypothetical protein